MTTTGPNSPAAGANLDFGESDWVNPGNIVSSNDTRATCVLVAQFSDSLRASQFGFSIAADQQIDGVTVEVEGSVSTGSLDCRVELYDGAGFTAGTNGAAYVEAFTTTEAYKTFGGVSDLWNSVLLTPTLVNTSGFGCIFYGNASYTGTISVDHIRITITHTTVVTKRPSITVVRQSINRSANF